MKKLIIGLLLLVCFNGESLGQDAMKPTEKDFKSKQELNNYIFQNSELDKITKGYFLDYIPDFERSDMSSFFGEIQREVKLEQLLAYLKIMEDTDVSNTFEIDSLLFPIMDRLYANNSISPIAIPLFICDVQFHHLNEETYSRFTHWGNNNPFPQLSENDLNYKHELMTGFFADSLRNQNIRLYWNEDTYFSNTERSIEKVHLIIDGELIHLERNRFYNLNDYYNGTLQSINISIQFDDGTIENKKNKVFFTNVQEKSDCAEQFGFTGNDRPWTSLGGLCKWGVDTLHNNASQDFPYLDMNFSVLWGCGGPKILDKPYIIVTGWGPYTDRNIINSNEGWPSSIQDAYTSFNQEGFIDNLVEAGYDVIIVKLHPPNQSILKNSILIERLIKMVNEEKFSNESYEENIISGYSAGAMCVRLTLQRMEKEHLDGTNEHHHSKLFVSYDGEHGGANVPLALQHIVVHLEDYQNMFNTGWFAESLRIYALHYILNAPLSKELLKYFHTETGTSSIQTMGQGSHPERIAYLQYHDWYNHSKNTHNPGYPAFTRNISISNGTSQSKINFPIHDHYPFPPQEGQLIFKHKRWQRKWEASFLGNSAATPWVFKYEEKSWGQWDIEQEARVHNPLILDNSPGGTTFLAGLGSSKDPNITFQVLKSMEKRATVAINGDADHIDYKALYTFTPTILTHDIRNFDPSLTGGRLDYDMKAEGLMYESLSDFNAIPPLTSSYFGYPHLAHPQDHYTNYTPFDAVFAWDKVNTVHIQSGEAKYNQDGNDDRGKWEQIYSPIRGVIKNFIIYETDFFNAFIQNRRYGWNARSNYTYKANIVARNEIYAGENVTQRTDFNPAEIQQNADISFTACKSVNLKSGFHAQSGSIFHAKVNSDVCGCTYSNNGINTNGYRNYDPERDKTQEVLYRQEKDVNSMDIRLYPNPAREHVNLEIHEEGVEGFMYVVFDLHGKQILQKQINKNYTTLSLTKGVYILKIKINDQWYNRKLIMY